LGGEGWLVDEHKAKEESGYAQDIEQLAAQFAEDGG